MNIRHVQLNRAPDTARPLYLRTPLGPRLKVDAEQGVIRNVAVLTAGEVRPSNSAPFMVDAVTLAQVRDLINAAPGGLKNRLTHPELDGVDGIELLVGSIRNARLDGDQVIAKANEKLDASAGIPVRG